MAFPTTITTDGLGTVGCGGPYVSSGGNVYLIVADDDRTDLRAFKGVNPDTVFSAVGIDVVIGSVGAGDFINAIAAHQVGDVIHILTKNSNGSNPVDLRYHVFNMGTDSWTTTNDMIKTNYATASPGVGWRCGIGITVRGDGAIIAVYNGSYETVSTVQYDRVYYARNQGVAWTADFALGTAGVAASWVGGNVILGGLDRVHFFIADRTNKKLYQRSMDSGYSLETLPASPGISVSLEDAEVSWMQGGVYVTASGIVTQPVYNSFETLHRIVGTSTAAAAISVSADITGARAVLTTPIKYVASFAVDGSVLWNVFIDTANDIYTQNYSAGTWSTPVGFQTGSVSAVYANVYTRGSALVLGIAYHDTDPKYSELTLSSLAAGSVVAPQGLLLTGVGR